jgi:hypothetical protein
MLLKECETTEEDEIAVIIEEIIEGQRRLF